MVALAAVMAACLLLSFPVKADIASGTSGGCTWVIDDAGTLTIRPTNGVSGTLESYVTTAAPWQNNTQVTSVIIQPGVKTRESAKLFYGLSNCESMVLSNLDTSNSTTMNNMFRNCTKLKTLVLSDKFNTSNVTTMTYMFSGCSAIQSLELPESFDTTKVTSMGYMFMDCNSLASLIFPDSVNTSSATSMRNMFNNCKSLVSLDLSGFNTSNVTGMESMFDGCSKLTSLNLTGFNTSNVRSMDSMFQGCSSLTSLDLMSFNTSKVTDMDEMFDGCSAIKTIKMSDSFNTSNVTRMYSMFNNCKALKTLDLPDSFITTKVTIMNMMFRYCSSLTSLNLTGFNTSNVTNMHYMFYNCKARSIKFPATFRFKGKNISSTSNQALLDTPPSNSTYTGKWIREDEAYGPYTPAQLRTNFDNNPTALAGTWVWEEVPTKYTVKFIAPEGAAGAMENQKVTAAENWTITANAFKRFNYHFVRWRGSNGKTYTDQQTIPANTFSPGYVLTLTAVMEKNDNHATIEDGVLDITLHGGEKITLPALPGGTKYQIWEETPAGWQLVDQLNPSGVIPANGTADASFTNEYVPGTTTVQLIATKTMDGRAPEEGAYTFRLEKDGELIQETANDGTGVVMFDTLIFRQPGDFTYTITEVRGDDAGISYDPHAETITIHVEDDGSGTLTATTTYDADGAKFVNESKPGTLTVTKRTEGGGDPEEEFTFEIRLTDELGRNLDNVSIVIQ